MIVGKVQTSKKKCRYICFGGTLGGLFASEGWYSMSKLLPCPVCHDSWLYVSDNTYGANYECKE